MKKVIVIAAIAIATISNNSFAQSVAQSEIKIGAPAKPTATPVANPKLEQAIGAALGQMATVRTPEELVAVGNTFSRIANAETKEWLPLYYAALCKVNAGYWSMKTKGMAAAQELAKAALADTEAALKIAPAESELAVMQAYVYQLQLLENPMSNGATYTPMILGALGKAEALNPANPRVNFIRGQFLMNMPEAYGGGVARASADIKAAAAKFEAFKPASAVAPNWGVEQNAAILKQLEAKK